jgi:hypothetical protein
VFSYIMIICAAAVSVEDIISYAHKISYSTFAPPSYLINQELPPGFQPPAPQAEHMRASALYQFTDEELGFRPPPSAAPIEMKAEGKESQARSQNALHLFLVGTYSRYSVNALAFRAIVSILGRYNT